MEYSTRPARPSVRRVEADCHELPIGRYIKDLSAITAPAWLGTAEARNRHSISGRGEPLHNNPAPTSYAALTDIRNPLPVRGKLRLCSGSQRIDGLVMSGIDA